MDPVLEARLRKHAAATRRRPDTGDVHVTLRATDGSWTFTDGDDDAPFFIASAAKMHTAALVLQLADEGLLSLHEPFRAHLTGPRFERLHVRDGVDRTDEITVRQLLSQTSGLPDYFEGKRADGPTTFARAVRDDTGWTLDDVLAITRGMRPAFDPGAPGKALYSDSNYQLLGALVETLRGASFADAVAKHLVAPLGLTGTWVFGTDTLDRYDEVATMLDRRAPLRIPRTMASVQADGGVVSTPADCLRFLRGFFDGELFGASRVPELQAEWRRIFPPLQYGTGLMRYALPPLMTLGRRTPAMVGHGGASGTVLFRVADAGVDLVATVNQVRNRRLPYVLASRLVGELHAGPLSRTRMPAARAPGTAGAALVLPQTPRAASSR